MKKITFSQATRVYLYDSTFTSYIEAEIVSKHPDILNFNVMTLTIQINYFYKCSSTHTLSLWGTNIGSKLIYKLPRIRHDIASSFAVAYISTIPFCNVPIFYFSMTIKSKIYEI